MLINKVIAFLQHAGGFTALLELLQFIRSFKIVQTNQSIEGECLFIAAYQLVSLHS